LGFLERIFSLSYKYSSSIHSAEIPLDIEPVILLTELKAPAIVFLSKEPAPYAIPNPPSKGPLAKPSAGFSTKSITPVDIFLNKPTGFPITFNEPHTLNT
jgi:hypothetical protein